MVANQQNKTFDNKTAISIIGAGPAGMVAALSLAHKGIHSVLIGPQTNPDDYRTTALMMPAIEALKTLNVWDDVNSHAAALSTMRIIDGTQRLIRSPTVSFKAAEIGEKAFGYNMPNQKLNDALEKNVTGSSFIQHIEANVQSLEHKEDHIILTLPNGQLIKSQLVVAADGRQSPAREAAGIRVRQWKYPQTAVILSFQHEFPHHNISTEFHTEEGPFTQVPLQGKRSSLVWVCNPQHAQVILSCGPLKLAGLIENRMHSMLGKVTVDTPVQAWPLSGIVPDHFAAKRTILVGEAAHVFPPIGAQGLNLGIRDALQLAEVVSKADDPGSQASINAYNKQRRPDIWMRTGSVDALNRALLSNLLPAQLARSVGLEILRNFSPLRNIFMREGMHPGNGFKHAIQACLPNIR